jgi:endo-alpha-1,4-polygalactosaminidase (GH114 family)
MTQDEIIKMARQVGMRYREIEDEFYSGYADGVYLDELEAFAKLVADKERESCAKVCETMARRTNDIRRAALEVAAENIMAKGQT